MTKHECAVVMAFTGKAMLTGEDVGIFYKYIEDKIGRPIWTHELAAPEMWHRIREACKNDFIELCRTATD